MSEPPTGLHLELPDAPGLVLDYGDRGDAPAPWVPPARAVTVTARLDDRLLRQLQRDVLRAFGIKPHQIGLGVPPLAIDGHAYRRRLRNRVKRKNRSR